MILRDYQQRAVDGIRARFAAGAKRVVLIAPTGAGKTVMFSHMVARAAERGRRCIVIAHRRELIDQTHAKLAACGVEAGVIMANDPRADDYLPVQVCSIQTLHRRRDRLPPADLIVYDECHHALSQSSRDVLDAYPDAYVIGATATPWRTDRLGLGDLFEDHVVAATMRELIEHGSLVDYEPFAYDSPDLHDVGTVAGEFNLKELALACNTAVLVSNIVREYRTHAHGRPAIVFPVDITHSKDLVAEFRAAGYRAEHLDCDTPREERDRMINGLRTGAVTVLSSVGVLTEGFDAPAAEVCILARPTKSLSLYLQMAGRVLRPAPGKTRALIHDHGGNLLRHGLPCDDRDYSLTATPQRVRDVLTCPSCRIVVSGFRRGCCPRCGELVAPNEPAVAAPEKARKGKKFVEGERLDRAAIEAIRGKLGNITDREFSEDQLEKIARATRQEKAAEYLRLVGVARRKGFKPGFAAHAYRATFGVWPRFSDADLEGVQPATRPFIPLARRTVHA